MGSGGGLGLDAGFELGFELGLELDAGSELRSSSGSETGSGSFIETVMMKTHCALFWLCDIFLVCCRRVTTGCHLDSKWEMFFGKWCFTF